MRTRTTTLIPLPTTTTVTTTTTTTLPPTVAPDVTNRPCDLGQADQWLPVDLDGVAPDEAVTLITTGDDGDGDGPDGRVISVCDGDTPLGSLEFGGDDVSLVGFTDLDDDGRRELLVGNADGTAITAITFTIRGLEPTDLALERFFDGDTAAVSGPFDAVGFECADFDDDGDLDLLVVSYSPAGELLNVEPGVGDDIVRVQVAVVTLEGTTTGSAGVDSYETDFLTAFERWSDDSRCALGTPARVTVAVGANDWGRVDLDREEFSGEGDVVLTGIDHGGTEDRFVVVGTEHPSMLVGDYFEPRPAIWSSPDALHWERADLGIDPAGELRDVAALPDGQGFVAVGSTNHFTAAAWVSADGRSWELVEVASALEGSGYFGPVMSQVIDTPLGIVAVGSEDYASDQPGAWWDTDPTVWISSDGRSWDRIQHPAFGTVGYQPNTGDEFNGELVGVAYTERTGLVVVGSASEADPNIDFPTQVATAWTSMDGVQWVRHDIGGDLRLRNVVTTPHGFAAVGVSHVHGSPIADAVVLTSADGIEWSPADGEFGDIGGTEGIQTINGAIAVPGIGVAAYGSDETEFEFAGGAAVWWSYETDAGGLSDWVRVAHDNRVFEHLDQSPTATMTDAVGVDGRLVVLGFSGRSVDLPGGSTGCCVIEPAVWMWPAEGLTG